MKLDFYDSVAILVCKGHFESKSDIQYVENLKKFNAKRCAINIDRVNSESLVNYLEGLIERTISNHRVSKLSNYLINSVVDKAKFYYSDFNVSDMVLHLMCFIALTEITDFKGEIQDCEKVKNFLDNPKK